MREPTNKERNAEARRMSEDSLRGYRESGVVDEVEVRGDASRCSACRNGFVGVHSINDPLEIPHPNCDHTFGFCVAAYLPKLNMELGA